MSKMFLTHPSHLQVAYIMLYTTLFPTHRTIVESSNGTPLGPPPCVWYL